MSSPGRYLWCKKDESRKCSLYNRLTASSSVTLDLFALCLHFYYMEANVQNNLFVFRGITLWDFGYNSVTQCTAVTNLLGSESTFSDTNTSLASKPRLKALLYAHTVRSSHFWIVAHIRVLYTCWDAAHISGFTIKWEHF